MVQRRLQLQLFCSHRVSITHAHRFCSHRVSIPHALNWGAVHGERGVRGPRTSWRGVVWGRGRSRPLAGTGAASYRGGAGVQWCQHCH